MKFTLKQSRVDMSAAGYLKGFLGYLIDVDVSKSFING